MQELLKNLEKLHTTELGAIRIKRNLTLDERIDAVEFCKIKIADPKTRIERVGKNYYASTLIEVITINASKLSIITAHKIKNKI